jgi:hypothetical protein
MRGTRALLVWMTVAAAVATGPAAAAGPFSAWRLLIERDPGIVDDASVDWRERLILHALTPRQAEAYFSGRATAEELILEDGGTLAAYLRRGESAPGGVYVSLGVACRLFEDGLEGAATFALGPASGAGAPDCAIPADALAVVLTVGAASADGRLRVKVWSAGYPEPASAALEGTEGIGAGVRTATTVVNLCRESWCGTPGLSVRGDGAVLVFGDVLGYFRPAAAEGIGAVPIFPLATEGLSNNFFGQDAGANTTGAANSFFGGEAGRDNTTGAWNAFFGRAAGLVNTTGGNNASFGRRAGFSNTTASHNAFFGNEAGNFNTTGQFNAFFGSRAGFSNTAGFNSFFGGEAGFSNTTGAANAFFGAGAGSSNTTGFSNSFFGRSGGTSNTVGYRNSFFGRETGFFNTTGIENSFLGFRAGFSNTVEDNNTFIGAFSSGSAGITNATALGWRAQVTQSNSLVLGSIAGLNESLGPHASVNVGIGVAAPQRQLHLKGNNAVFRMDRDSDTAAFMIVRTNAAGSPLKTFVVGTNAAGADNGEFVVNDLGAAVGGPGA